MNSDLAHILVVDDDTRLRNLLKKFLNDNGFRVTTADNAESAKDVQRSIQFDQQIPTKAPRGLRKTYSANYIQKFSYQPTTQHKTSRRPKFDQQCLNTQDHVVYCSRPYGENQLVGSLP